MRKGIKLFMKRAIKLNSTEIVTFLKMNFHLNLGWKDMIAETYKQQTEKRKRKQKPDGHQITKSKIFELPVSKIQKAWMNDHRQSRWFHYSPFIICRIMENKSICL